MGDSLNKGYEDMPRYLRSDRISDTQFSSGAVNFGGARFSGGEVDFGAAQFSGGTVDFCRADDWPVPPIFPWTDTPPPGVQFPS
jgi:hypothetical protein